MSELLAGKTAVIYGAGGSIGGAVARTFAREGATVVLAGRTRATLERVAGGHAAVGGRATVVVVDALDERAVDEHADAAAAQCGRPRHLVEPHPARRRPGHADRRDDARALPARDHGGLLDGVSDGARRGAPHGAAGFRRDPAPHKRLVARHRAGMGTQPDRCRDGAMYRYFAASSGRAASAW
jgi:NAD(P)-dependent dehydrogenase (short-subunit alcohol dehydrogenase family)